MAEAKKNDPVLFGLLALLLGGAGYYIYTKKNTPSSEGQSTSELLAKFSIDLSDVNSAGSSGRNLTADKAITQEESIKKRYNATVCQLIGKYNELHAELEANDGSIDYDEELRIYNEMATIAATLDSKVKAWRA
jgi:hypothetical protein